MDKAKPLVSSLAAPEEPTPAKPFRHGNPHPVGSTV
jgi:hypothetical protein